ncbi:MAG: hypothetical protein IV086_17765 [Hyphomonadaceae bacterium]|nr:hypothetical protein [Hyphomonadaceae bacterium]
MQFVQVVFQNWENQVSDSQVYEEAIRLGMLAAELGFDALWPVEHHFADYPSARTTRSSSATWPPAPSGSSWAPAL